MYCCMGVIFVQLNVQQRQLRSNGANKAVCKRTLRGRFNLKSTMFSCASFRHRASTLELLTRNDLHHHKELVGVAPILSIVRKEVDTLQTPTHVYIFYMKRKSIYCLGDDRIDVLLYGIQFANCERTTAAS